MEAHNRAALFVDFDNIYLGLREWDKGAAEKFATQPSSWLKGLGEMGGSSAAEECARSFLVRRCYLNPVAFGKYRAHFTRAAFQVIDCPPLTNRGKNSADIQMAMDILDTLDHPTHFSEFVIMSGDADFTPILLRLRAHARRTFVVTTSPAAQAFKAACDYVLAEEEFVEEALGTTSALGPSKAEPRLRYGLDGGASGIRLHERIVTLVRHNMAARKTPMLLAELGNILRQELGQEVTASKWAGHGTLSALLRTALPEYTVLLAPAGAGYLVDEERHEVPDLDVTSSRWMADAPPDLVDFVVRVSDVTGAPQLAPAEYEAVFRVLARELEERGFNSLETSKAVRDQCRSQGVIVSRGHVNFIIRGVASQDYGLHGEPRPHAPEDLAQAFCGNLIDLSTNARMVAEVEDGKHLVDWVMHGVLRDSRRNGSESREDRDG